MDTRRVFLVDAFTDRPLTGNGAGVVPNAEGISAAQMRAITSELRQSETGFVLPSDDADHRVRFFTPTHEIDLCGHATLACHAGLQAAGGVETGSYTLETNVGTIGIEGTDEAVWMTMPEPEIRKVDQPYGPVADALGVREAALTGMRDDLPLARAATGVPYLVIPVEYLSDLSEMDPDMQALESMAEAHECSGIYVFTFDTLAAESTVHARMFAPGLGIPEDPVTGTACGACGAYLDRFGAFDPTPAEMVIEQGFFLDRGGHARVEARSATADGDVRVGGATSLALDGEIRVPDLDDNDIIEA